MFYRNALNNTFTEILKEFLAVNKISQSSDNPYDRLDAEMVTYLQDLLIKFRRLLQIIFLSETS